MKLKLILSLSLFFSAFAFGATEQKTAESTQVEENLACSGNSEYMRVCRAYESYIVYSNYLGNYLNDRDYRSAAKRVYAAGQVGYKAVIAAQDGREKRVKKLAKKLAKKWKKVKKNKQLRRVKRKNSRVRSTYRTVKDRIEIYLDRLEDFDDDSDDDDLDDIDDSDDDDDDDDSDDLDDIDDSDDDDDDDDDDDFDDDDL